jgi:murein DD-endopeptidase MepM/ murein hydrolase activator NlpD
MRNKLRKLTFLASIIFVASLTLIGIASFVAAQNGSPGQNIDELAEQKRKKQEELARLDREVKDLQSKIKEHQQAAASLRNEIALFNAQILQTETQIQAAELRIEVTQETIEDVEAHIIQKQEQIQLQKERLAELIRLLNDLDDLTPLEVLMSRERLSEVIDESEHVASIEERNTEILQEVRRLKEELEQQREELKKQEEELKHLQAQLEITRKALEAQRQAKVSLLQQTRGQERAFRSVLAKVSGAQDDIEREIFDLDLQLRQRLGTRKLPTIRGLLSWPLDGILTQGFGATDFALNSGFYASKYHTGIDIAAPAGTPIRAAAAGIVVDQNDSDAAYGNWVAIRHTITSKSGQAVDVITLYAHLQSSVVADGQRVEQDEVIGYEGNTGNTTRLIRGPGFGYHVHFGVCAADSFTVSSGKFESIYGPYRVPSCYWEDPLDFL